MPRRTRARVGLARVRTREVIIEDFRTGSFRIESAVPQVILPVLGFFRAVISSPQARLYLPPSASIGGKLPGDSHSDRSHYPTQHTSRDSGIVRIRKDGLLRADLRVGRHGRLLWRPFPCRAPRVRRPWSSETRAKLGAAASASSGSLHGSLRVQLHLFF
jgi:hypothetical protein